MEFLHKAMETFGFENVWTVDGRTVCLDEISKKPKTYFDLSKMACCFLGGKKISVGFSILLSLEKSTWYSFSQGS